MTKKEIKEKLHSDKPMIFSYTKKNGELRVAKGTLNINVMGEENAPSGKIDTTNEINTIRYYDILAKGWRSFLVNNFIEFIE